MRGASPIVRTVARRQRTGGLVTSSGVKPGQISIDGAGLADDALDPDGDGGYD